MHTIESVTCHLFWRVAYQFAVPFLVASTLGCGAEPDPDPRPPVSSPTPIPSPALNGSNDAAPPGAASNASANIQFDSFSGVGVAFVKPRGWLNIASDESDKDNYRFKFKSQQESLLLSVQILRPPDSVDEATAGDVVEELLKLNELEPTSGVAGSEDSPTLSTEDQAFVTGRPAPGAPSEKPPFWALKTERSSIFRGDELFTQYAAVQLVGKESPLDEDELKWALGVIAHSVIPTAQRLEASEIVGKWDRVSGQPVSDYYDSAGTWVASSHRGDYQFFEFKADGQFRVFTAFTSIGLVSRQTATASATGRYTTDGSTIILNTQRCEEAHFTNYEQDFLSGCFYGSTPAVVSAFKTDTGLELVGYSLDPIKSGARQISVRRLK
jgi:hypothetical protein